MKEYIVYCHQNKSNGKLYYGISSGGTDYRWNNGHGYKTNKSFHEDIQKYGWDGFLHSVVATNLCEEDARRLEDELILASGSRNPAVGYNRLFNFQSSSAAYKNDSSKTEQQTRMGNKNERISVVTTSSVKSDLQKIAWTQHILGVSGLIHKILAEYVKEHQADIEEYDRLNPVEVS